jgi:NAD(P)-dependent dehydrogenase (short-subunit alcohol dehydrogenase family)
MAISLVGKKVAITGGSSGIGKAIARLAIAAGASAVLIGRSSEKLATATTELGPQVQTHRCDVTDEGQVEQVFANIGHIDHLVCAAAGTYRAPMAEIDTARARALFESKFWGQHHCIKNAIPCLASDGSITLFSGWISRKPMVGTGTLAAVDGAIESLARVLSLELSPRRVNTIVPGQVNTPLWSARFDAAQQADYFSKLGSSLPTGRAGEADDIAEAVIFLMTNGYMTGATLDIDGGQGWGPSARSTLNRTVV